MKKLIILCLLTLSITANSCPTFQCGEIPKEATPSLCLYKDLNWTVEKCPKEYSCQANKITSVKDAKNLSCAKEISTNKLAGEQCSEDTHCYEDLQCEKGRCKGRGSGDSCENQYGRVDHRFCAEGLFCGEKGICEGVSKFGEICSSAKPCEFGTLCARTKEDLEYNCKNLFSLEDGLLVDLSQVFPMKTVAYDIEDICESGHLLRSNKGTICMPGPKLVDSMRMKVNGAGEECKYHAFKNPDDLTDFQEFIGYSKCGFNTNSSGYCDVYKGDKEYVSAIEGYQKIIESKGTDCHLLSTLSKCKNLKGKDLKSVKEWEHAQFYIGEGSYAAVADNDKCVKSEIMLSFWKDDAFFNSLAILGLSSILSLIYLT